MPKVTLIEDQAEVRRYVEAVLTGRGYTVESYADCASGIEALNKALPDLLLTDLRLPDGSGLELIGALKVLTDGKRSVPSIVVSGCLSEEEMLKAYAAGASDYLTKPFVPSELLAKSSVALRRAEDATKEDWRTEETEAWPCALRPGRLIGGRFAIEREIGEGTYGRVFVARDIRDGGRSALKLAKPGRWDEESRARFLREVYTLGSVRSPYVAELIGSGRVKSYPYIAMGFVEGPTLATRIARSGPLSLERVRKLLIGLARAALALEEVDLVHRDIKPANVILRGGDVAVPVLIDFGLAKRPHEHGLTVEGVIQGTPGYVSPEVLNGDSETRFSDQFSIGMTVLYAATGELPFDLRGMPLLRKMSSTPVPVPPELPPWLRSCLTRLTRLKATQRYASARNLLDFLGR